VEWSFEPERLAELRTVAVQTGGRELLDLSKAWLRPPTRQDVSLRLWIALAMLVFLIAEALMTRTGWKLPIPALPQFREREKVVKPKRVKVVKPVAPVQPIMPEDKPVVMAKEAPEDTERRSRYQRAKDKK
jgi:hypothetical protein